MPDVDETSATTPLDPSSGAAPSLPTFWPRTACGRKLTLARRSSRTRCPTTWSLIGPPATTRSTLWLEYRREKSDRGIDYDAERSYARRHGPRLAALPPRLDLCPSRVHGDHRYHWCILGASFVVIGTGCTHRVTRRRARLLPYRRRCRHLARLSAPTIVALGTMLRAGGTGR